LYFVEMSILTRFAYRDKRKLSVSLCIFVRRFNCGGIPMDATITSIEEFCE
jgi:hypothetical protein